MRIVVCPGCGHKNRSAIVATICDRCGEDISTVAPTGAAETPLVAPRTDEVTVTPGRAVPAPSQSAPEPEEPADGPEPEQRAAGMSLLSLVVKLSLAGAVICGGILLSIWVPLGSALATDSLISGSVAILAGATAMMGLVLLVVGFGSRSRAFDVGMRAIGLVLALIGVWAMAAIWFAPGPDPIIGPRPGDPSVLNSFGPHGGPPGGPGTEAAPQGVPQALPETDPGVRPGGSAMSGSSPLVGPPKSASTTDG